tara:strand:- start:141 stop:608 length:468 start_codon:yes stop_codon:yes gene_type:complete
MKKLFVSEYDVKLYSSQLIRLMVLDNYKPDYVIGFARGGIQVANYISQWYDIPMYCINKGGPFSNNELGYCGTYTKEFQKNILPQYENILVVDDINDSGNTLSKFKGSYDSDKKFKYGVLIENSSSPFYTDYAGHFINKLDDPCWVVFPWENWWM